MTEAQKRDRLLDLEMRLPFEWIGQKYLDRARELQETPIAEAETGQG